MMLLQSYRSVSEGGFCGRHNYGMYTQTLGKSSCVSKQSSLQVDLVVILCFGYVQAVLAKLLKRSSSWVIDVVLRVWGLHQKWWQHLRHFLDNVESEHFFIKWVSMVFELLHSGQTAERSGSGVQAEYIKHSEYNNTKHSSTASCLVSSFLVGHEFFNAASNAYVFTTRLASVRQNLARTILSLMAQLHQYSMLWNQRRKKGLNHGESIGILCVLPLGHA